MRDFFFKDLGWKIFSLLLAAALWFIANRILHEHETPAAETGSSSITFGSLPVKIVCASADVHEFRATPSMVKVTVVGPPSVMGALAADDLHATVTLAGAGLIQGTMLRVDIAVPPNVAVSNIEPNRVLVTLPPKEKQP
jgi:YbbR domain-containing protein